MFYSEINVLCLIGNNIGKPDVINCHTRLIVIQNSCNLFNFVKFKHLHTNEWLDKMLVL